MTIEEYTYYAQTEFENDLTNVCHQLKNMLLEKNKAYGDSVLNPVRIFSKASAIEQLYVRIDDKLSRLSRGNEMADESFDDTILDLAGYLIIYMIDRNRQLNKNISI